MMNSLDGRLYSGGGGGPYRDAGSLHDHHYGTATTSSNATSSPSSGGVGFGVVLVNPSLRGNGTIATFTETTTTATTYGEGRNWVVVGVLIALIIMLWVVLGGMLCYPLLRFIRRRMPVSQRRINRRYETIEGWLITKVVRPHDDGCEQIQTRQGGDDDPRPDAATGCDADDIENQKATTTASLDDEDSTWVKNTESYDTADTTIEAADDSLFFYDGDDDDSTCRDCPICMECFVVDDVVSWSSYDKCSHVFHHQCIKEWLLRHNNCPFCRLVFLPVDQAQVKISVKVFKELSDLRSKRAEKTYYCIQDGLVTLEQGIERPDNHLHDSSINNSTASTKLRKCGHMIRGGDTEQLYLRELLKPGVTKADLKQLRGDRCEKICNGETEILNVVDGQDFEEDEDGMETSSQRSSSLPDLESGCPQDNTLVREESLTIDTSDDDDEEERSDNVVEVDQDERIEVACSVGGESSENHNSPVCNGSVPSETHPVSRRGKSKKKNGKTNSGISVVNGSRPGRLNHAKAAPLEVADREVSAANSSVPSCMTDDVDSSSGTSCGRVHPEAEPVSRRRLSF